MIKNFMTLVIMFIIMTQVSLVSAQTSSPQGEVFHQNVDASSFQKLVNDQKGVLLDVRTANEFASGHIENAINVVYSMFGFEDQLKNLDKNKTYLIYCRSGARSGRALRIMKKNGFNQVYNLDGGLLSWQSNGLPIVK